MFWPGFVAGVLFILFVQFLLYVARPWTKAFLSGVRVPLVLIVAMRLRGNPPSRIIDAYVQMAKRGRLISLSEVEATYMAYRENATSVEALVRMLEEQFAERLVRPTS
jgi:uncharacterized protein YqfA (UPF0365 family)